MENDSINTYREESENIRRNKENKTRRSFSFRNIGEKINEWRVKDRKKGTVDLPFFFIVMILLVMGIIMMFSASYAWAISEGLPGIYYAKKQITYAVIGSVIMFIASKVDYHIFQSKFIAFGLYGVTLVMLVAVAIPQIGIDHNDARRWLGFGSFEFQPSEIMKFAIVIVYSLMIVSNQKFMKYYKKGIIPLLVILAPVVLLLMKQPHLSCTILICLMCFSLMYVGGMKHVHIFLTILAGVLVIGALVLYKMEVEGFTYFENRFRSWLKPFSDTTGVTWQTDQSLVAIGSGGFFGMGLGNSRQKFQYLPESKNDFVFSIVCEELGFVGAVTVILLFAFFVFRGFYIASKSQDRFGMLVCIGLTLQVGFQAFLNIAVVSNLIPNTGISLPFFSYGGTSLIMLLAQMGVILNISRKMLDNPEDEAEARRAEELRKLKKSARQTASRRPQ